jgi:hypothetical protein
MILADTKRLNALRIAFISVATLTSCWLNGKRAIVAIALCLFGYALWSRGLLAGRRLQVAIAGGALALLAFSLTYQRTFRDSDVTGSWSGGDTAYEGTRVDFFRDDRIRLTLFAELHPDEMQILDSRGQSLLFYSTFFVPRSLWSGKPWPYSTYFTSAALGIHPARPLGWGMTTSWLEEAVANLGWVGLLVAPLSLLIICRMGDAFRWPPIRMLTALVAVLLLTVQLIAFMPLFILWLVLAVALQSGKHFLRAREPKQDQPRPVPVAASARATAGRF